MLEKSAMSKAISGLVKKGLLSREARRGDRRYTLIRLTADGHARYRQILPVVEGINRDMLLALEDEEVAQLDRFFDRILARTIRMQESAPALPRADRRRGGTRMHDGH
jgi:DNA-binding MarR family transcriptional regulator